MDTVTELLTAGLDHFRRGEHEQAEQRCEEVLRADPKSAGALHLLSVIAHRTNRPALAIDCLGQAIVANPHSAELHYNLGTAYHTLGRLDEAIASYGEALRIDPDYAEACSNLGFALIKLGRPGEGVPHLRHAVQLKPAYAEAHNNLGLALFELGQSQDAIASLREAVRLKADYAEAHTNLGLALARAGDFDEALESYRAIERLRPDDAAVQNDLGFVLKEQGKLAEAMTSLHEALRLRPDYADAHNNLGVVLTEQGRLDEAVASLCEALRLKPDFVDGYNNLGLAYAAQGKLDQAQREHARALQLVPDHPPAHFFRALSWLQAGDFEKGWPEYEWRWDMPRYARATFPRPVWDGAPLAGRRILLYTEQGLGDTLQFIRYVALVKQAGGTVIVACQQPLLQLLARCPGIDRLVPTGPPWPDCDVHAPLLTLPRIFATTVATIPAAVPYLHPDPRLVEHWRGELQAVPGFKVGIGWQGNPKFLTDRRRSMPLSSFFPLARVAGISLISLQKGPGSEQVHALADRMAVLDLARRLDEDSGAFMDTAAVIKNLDLVITSDTALAHLAGGLGVPVWVALSAAPDWRWLLDRDDSPWYPTMRLFRQRRWGDWQEVFERMANQVREMLMSPRPASSALVPVAPGELASPTGDRVEATAPCSLGLAERNFSELEAAVLQYRQTLQLKPNSPAIAYNLGLALAALGKVDEALAAQEQALRLDPNHSGAPLARSCLLLLQGKFAEGWVEYEYRWRFNQTSLYQGPVPQWDGSARAGQTVLLYAEQGRGDTLQFIRYAPLVKQRARQVMLACPQNMIPILAACEGIDQLLAPGAPLPRFDVQAPLLRLPGIFGTTLDNIPSRVPYLHADPNLVEYWRQQLCHLAGLKIGIAWQGDPKFLWDRWRSMPLGRFALLASIPGVHLISLQKGPGSEQTQTLAGRLAVLDLAHRLDEDTGAFMDTAAVMKNLDLVITTDTAVAHLAGGLGVPVWVALSVVPDWRWLLDRDDSPWYPTMRLFRQRRWGDWQEVFERMANQVREMLMSPRPASSALVPVAPGELIDKITILQIKAERIADAAKRHNVGVELAALAAARDGALTASPELARLTAELKSINKALWDIEDAIRDCERAQDFGPRFIELARSVYRQNDRRAALKRQVNELLGSKLIEEKSYASYAQNG